MAYAHQKTQGNIPNKTNILLGFASSSPKISIEVARAATNLLRLDDPSTPPNECKHLREWFRYRFLKQPIAFRRQAFQWVRVRRYQGGD